MQCANALRLQAYFDGESDPQMTAEVARHLERCVECRALLVDWQQMRAAIRRESTFATAPAELRHRVLRALDYAEDGRSEELRVADEPISPGKRRRGFWAGACSGVGASALAAALIVFLIAPLRLASLTGELVDAHLRSLMPDHLIEVISTDRHTVKPWFAGRADVSPIVADFATAGYRLLGGRTDTVERQRAAVTVYEHGPHVINVFSWVASGALPMDSLRNGYRVVFWKSGDLAYCAVSDTGWDELHTLVSLLRGADARENKAARTE